MVQIGKCGPCWTSNHSNCVGNKVPDNEKKFGGYHCPCCGDLEPLERIVKEIKQRTRQNDLDSTNTSKLIRELQNMSNEKTEDNAVEEKVDNDDYEVVVKGAKAGEVEIDFTIKGNEAQAEDVYKAFIQILHDHDQRHQESLL